MTKNLSRREFMRVTGLAAGALLLQACGGATKPPATSAPAASAPAVINKPVTLKFWTHQNQAMVAYIEKKIKEYKSVRPRVTIEHAPVDVQPHEDRLFTSLATGSGPDGFNMGDWNFPRLALQDLLAPVLPEAFESNSQQALINRFFDFSLVGMLQNNTLFGIPFEWNALDLYYNRGEFLRAGLDPDNPPQTWEEVTEAAMKLVQTDEVGNITFLGFRQSYGNSEWTLKRLHPMLVQAGLDFLNPEMTRSALNTPEAVEIIEYYTDWTTKGLSTPGFELPGDLTGNPFRIGFAGMDLSGPYNVGSIKKANPDWEFGADDGWDIAPFPQWGAARQVQQASAMWRWGLFVNKQSPHAAEMWAFINFLVENPNELNADVGYIPSLKGWLDDPDIIAERPWLAVQKQGLAMGVPVPQTPFYQEIAQEVLEMTERVYAGSATVSEAVATACQNIDVILA
jgi:ABC-type glycerol-3-phosphate transport system substrate-binding protein